MKIQPGPPQQQPKPLHPELGMKEQALNWVISRIIRVTNRRVNIRNLQKQYHAEQGRVMSMSIVDLGRKWYFHIKDGNIEVLSGPGNCAGGFEANADVIMNLAVGSRRYMDPANGQFRKEKYTPFEAITHGDVRIWGDAASNDYLLFARAVQDVIYPEVLSEMQSSEAP